MGPGFSIADHPAADAYDEHHLAKGGGVQGFRDTLQSVRRNYASLT